MALEVRDSSGINVVGQAAHEQTLSRYREGQALVLELTDAFTQLTNNRLALNAARASRLIRQAELERALAAYTF